MVALAVEEIKIHQVVALQAALEIHLQLLLPKGITGVLAEAILARLAAEEVGLRQLEYLLPLEPTMLVEMVETERHPLYQALQ